jgi:hypothetical protein
MRRFEWSTILIACFLCIMLLPNAASAKCITSVGGAGGERYGDADGAFPPFGTDLAYITIWSGNCVDAIDYRRVDGTSSAVIGGGKEGGVPQQGHSLPILDPGEHITSIDFTVGRGDFCKSPDGPLVHSLAIWTEKRQLNPGCCGTPETDDGHIHMEAPAGYYIAGFCGSAGALINSLGVDIEKIEQPR